MILKRGQLLKFAVHLWFPVIKHIPNYCVLETYKYYICTLLSWFIVNLKTKKP